jgi:2-oxoglutarate ferredoxin oxidoreductase subunit gamma
MERSVVIAGFGGQGVILAGKILAQAGMNHGLEVTWLPSYGPEMRGGTANCTVILSDTAIGSPIVDEPTAVIALNLPSLDKFESTVAQKGVLLINRSLIARDVTRKDITAHVIPLNEIAARVGSARTVNMVALGAYVKATGAVPLDVVKQTMAAAMRDGGKEKLIAVNEKALDEGYAAVT